MNTGAKTAHFFHFGANFLQKKIFISRENSDILMKFNMRLNINVLELKKITVNLCQFQNGTPFNYLIVFLAL